MKARATLILFVLLAAAPAAFGQILQGMSRQEKEEFWRQQREQACAHWRQENTVTLKINRWQKERALAETNEAINKAQAAANRFAAEGDSGMAEIAAGDASERREHAEHVKWQLECIRQALARKSYE